MASDSYHEPYDLLSGPTRDMHRALTTLIEELEAIDWYQQRAEACTDDELRAVILHNRNEEIEHATMALEWLRRNDPVFEAHLRTYLFSEAPIPLVERESEAERGGEPAGAGKGRAAPVRSASGAPSPALVAGSPGAGSLGIGSLKIGSLKIGSLKSGSLEEG